MSRNTLGSTRVSGLHKKPLLFAATVAAVGLFSLPASATRGGGNQAGPWYTGPLLAPTPGLVPPGTVDIQPYIFISDQLGQYNNNWSVQSSANNVYSFNPQYVVQVGLLSFMDVTLVPSVMVNWTDNVVAYGFGDLPITFGFQTSQQSEPWWGWETKLTFTETLPFGRYNQLNPDEKGTDITGSGSFATTLSAIAQKSIHLVDSLYIKPRFAFQYIQYSGVPVMGLNSYGGTNGSPTVPGSATLGTVYPGNTFQGYASFELSITKHWVFAWDTFITASSKPTFSGQPGKTSAGERMDFDGTSSNAISLAPAVEYNFTYNLGIIGGVWFSVAGRNSKNFITPAISLVYYESMLKDER